MRVREREKDERKNGLRNKMIQAKIQSNEDLKRMLPKKEEEKNGNEEWGTKFEYFFYLESQHEA